MFWGDFAVGYYYQFRQELLGKFSQVRAHHRRAVKQPAESHYTAAWQRSIFSGNCLLESAQSFGLKTLKSGDVRQSGFQVAVEVRTDSRC